MKLVLIVAEMLCTISIGWAQSRSAPTRIEAEYYVTTYARHYRVPIALVRAIVVRESNWQPCVISSKGAVGLMQLPSHPRIWVKALGFWLRQRS